ncbi:MAG TPA: AMP-binding protein, partial [Steroidobacter sp.]|nr:AMP-binding protein [Steroidobacter sp.]
MHELEASAPLLPEIFALHGRWRANREALVCDDVRETWGEFARSVNRFGNALLKHGVKPRERVAMLMSNGVPMVHALFGTMNAGAVSVPLNVSISDEAALGMLHDSGASAIVATPDQRARIDALRNRLGPDVRLFLLADRPAAGWTCWETFIADTADAPPAVRIDDDDVLNIIYSSGTTGVPKGIVHTHRGRRDWAYDLGLALRYHGAARSLLTIGLYSNISWVSMLCTLLAGGTLVVHRRFDAAASLETVRRERITHTALVPIQLQRMVECMRGGDHDVSSMHAMMSCGSPLRAALKQELFEYFSCGIIELYGLTEGVITTLDPEDAKGRWSSVGKPLMGTDIRIIGDDDREAPQGEAGEIVSRGRVTMPGYFNRPEATSAAVWRDAEGRPWLRTGDIGRLDEQNFLYIVDRKKDLILSGGQNVYPQDIEAVLVTHAGVDDAAVIGLPSRRWEETPVAIVVPRDPASFDPDALRTWCNERVGTQQR